MSREKKNSAQERPGPNVCPENETYNPETQTCQKPDKPDSAEKDAEIVRKIRKLLGIPTEKKTDSAQELAILKDGLRVILAKATKKKDSTQEKLDAIYKKVYDFEEDPMKVKDGKGIVHGNIYT